MNLPVSCTSHEISWKKVDLDLFSTVGQFVSGIQEMTISEGKVKRISPWMRGGGGGGKCPQTCLDACVYGASKRSRYFASLEVDITDHCCPSHADITDHCCSHGW